MARISKAIDEATRTRGYLEYGAVGRLGGRRR